MGCKGGVGVVVRPRLAAGPGGGGVVARPPPLGKRRGGGGRHPPKAQAADARLRRTIGAGPFRVEASSIV